MKRLTWLGDSLANLRGFPPPVQDDIGYALYIAQSGETPRLATSRCMDSAVASWKLRQTTRAEPIALCTRCPSGTRFYVVHAFQKESKAGIATPKTEIELVRRRVKQLRSEVKNAE